MLTALKNSTGHRSLSDKNFFYSQEWIVHWSSWPPNSISLKDTLFWPLIFQSLKYLILYFFFISCKLSQKMFTEYILFSFAQEAFNNKSVKRDFSLLAQLCPYSGFSQFTEVRISSKLSWITRTGLAICLILSRVLELLWHFFVWAHRHKGDPWILRLEMLACSFAFDRLKHEVRCYNFFFKCWLSIIIIKTRRAVLITSSYPS